MVTVIPDSEFSDRVKRVQRELDRQDLDCLIAHSNESDPANVRYLSDYWPVFESAGVVVPRDGDPILLIGPESELYARDRSRIKKIMKLLEYRESAEPDYPGMRLSTFRDVFEEATGGRKVKRLGIAGYAIMPLPVIEGLRKVLPETEFVKADNILRRLRSLKSENEIAALRESSRTAEKAIESVLEKIKPGMTELQVVGIAQQALYENGAEYEGHALYVFSGKNTRHAISRPTHKKIRENELIQLNIGARVSGYSSSIGRPISIGRMPQNVRKLVEIGLELHQETRDLMREGIPAKEVAEKFLKSAERKGVKENVLYGPCHGIGLMEVEPPWIETTSDYVLKRNMTFQVDTFLYSSDFGLRWEDAVRVTENGVETFCNRWEMIMEI
ncbi:MAG: aminopeptidase P family protein [Thaumarchaeota archaeon]|nr:aminopeptidase P family protein [Nitrososphaerota archaeon]